MTTAEQNAKAIELAAGAARIRQYLIDYQAHTGSQRVHDVATAYAELQDLQAEFELVLSDMQQAT